MHKKHKITEENNLLRQLKYFLNYYDLYFINGLNNNI